MDLVVVPESQLREIIKTVVSDTLKSASPPPPISDPDKRLMIKEICEKYSISKPTVHKHMHQGLPYEKLGRKTLFRAEDAEAYFRSKSKNQSL